MLNKLDCIVANISIIKKTIFFQDKKHFLQYILSINVFNFYNRSLKQ